MQLKMEHFLQELNRIRHKLYIEKQPTIMSNKTTNETWFILITLSSMALTVETACGKKNYAKYNFIGKACLDEETLCPGRMGQHVRVNIQGALVITISVSSLEAVMSDNTTSRQLNISDYEFPDNQFLTVSIILQNDVVTRI